MDRAKGFEPLAARNYGGGSRGERVRDATIFRSGPLRVSRVSQLFAPAIGEVCKTAIGHATCIQREGTGSSCIQRIRLGKGDLTHSRAIGVMVSADKQESLMGEIRETSN